MNDVENAGLLASMRPYVQIMRIDHWFKNVFVLPGTVLAVFVLPELRDAGSLAPLFWALAATSLVASSNYVINEFLDAPYDRLHPVKYQRPAALGLVEKGPTVVLWALLAMLGIGLAFQVNASTGLAAGALWVMGIVYNVPPLRTKELAYVDVISESINNPIRLFIGWFALIPDQIPPASLAIAYWMMGAFFMAVKRFAEYRRIGDPEVAARYRRSFAYYDEDRLLVSLFFYALMSALFAGVFVIRYQLELILAIPLLAGFLTYYLRIGLRPDSPVQGPENLYREKGFVAYALVCVLTFLLLMFVHIPGLYRVFNVEINTVPPLWTLELP
jgi:decaprenyl-phosphate phosphoribosyltransferase